MNGNLNRKKHKSLGHPLATGSLWNNVRLVFKNCGFHPRFSLRVLNVFLSNLLLLPIRNYEKVKWSIKIKTTTIEQAPIFILGHWRCGTTHLHNLLAQDPRFGYVSTLQAFSPGICIETRFLLPIFKRLLPKKRPIDNMLMALELPQEEEYALANLCQLSFYHGYFYPEQMNAIFHRLLFLEDSPKLRQQWQSIYLTILKKATLIMRGKPLIIKNPLNTIRIPVLLELFPQAKFVHIYRNPYLVYYSTVFTFKTMIASYGFKKKDEEVIEENVLQIYEKMMKRFYDTRDRIPDGQYTEIRFEDLENAPLRELRRVYQQLRLPSFIEAMPRFKHYLKTQEGYQKNVYSLNPQNNQRIRSRWGWIIDRMGYQLHGKISIPH